MRPTEQTFHFYDDPDIGMCDDCGTEDGDTRYRTILTGTWDGIPGRCVAWLCGPCKRERNRRARNA